MIHSGKHARIIARVLSVDQPHKHEEKNADLTARLAVRERLHRAQITQLTRHKSKLEQKSDPLERENAQLKSQVSQYCETNLLLKEEIAWLKAQFYGRSSEKCAADEASPDQRMLFNEAEVLAAITAADEADAAPILIEAHERRQKPGRKVIPAESPASVSCTTLQRATSTVRTMARRSR